MATLVKEDGCKNAIQEVKASPNKHSTSMKREKKYGNNLSLPNANTVKSSPQKDDIDSVANRRERRLTALLIDAIIGKKLKCYEHWKLWLILFLIMTFIAVIAISLATVFAIKYSNAYKTKMEAANAQQTLLYELTHDQTSNFSDHTAETHKIFNTFDVDEDGVWNFNEFLDHFVLTSGVEATFNNMDANSDGILGYKEIIISLSKFNLSQSYIPTVDEIYDYIPDSSSDSLLNLYAANIYLDSYDVNGFGYIPRAYFYEFRANINFEETDTDDDGVINYEEFSNKIGNDQFIAFFRNWDLDAVLTVLNQSYIYHNYTNLTDADICPVNTHTNQRRRLLAKPNLGWTMENVSLDNTSTYLTYTYFYPPCKSKFICVNSGNDSNSWDINNETGCSTRDINFIVSCFITSFDNFMQGPHHFKDCYDSMLQCMGDFDVSRCAPYCWCECNGKCSAPPRYGAKSISYYSTRQKEDCNCICGGTCGECKDCPCFGGKSEMLIKRNEVVETVFLKDMRVGDYVQTKSSEWSKVWFIKERLGEFEFLNLYFDENEYITITADHLLYIDESMKRADQIQIGDKLFVMNESSSLFVEKDVVYIESVVLSDGAYSPVTMEGSVVVNKVLSSCYAQSVEMADKFHDAAAIFRWISRYNTDLGVIVTNFFYDVLFVGLRQMYDLEVAFAIFNGYSTPFIVIATAAIIIFPFFSCFV